jgi:uncharacterized protein (TIGR03067 family)
MIPEPLNEKTGAKPKDNIPSDRDAIQGTWSVILAVDSGRTAPPEALRDIRFVITKDKVTMELGGRKQESTYTLNPSTSPKSIDLTTNGHTKPGIYDLQGDTLRICTSEDTDMRPTAFDSQPDSVNDLVLTMKRMNPEPLSTKAKTEVEPADAEPQAESATGSETKKAPK